MPFSYIHGTDDGLLAPQRRLSPQGDRMVPNVTAGPCCAPLPFRMAGSPVAVMGEHGERREDVHHLLGAHLRDCGPRRGLIDDRLLVGVGGHQSLGGQVVHQARHPRSLCSWVGVALVRPRRQWKLHLQLARAADRRKFEWAAWTATCGSPRPAEAGSGASRQRASSASSRQRQPSGRSDCAGARRSPCACVARLTRRPPVAARWS